MWQPLIRSSRRITRTVSTVRLQPQHPANSSPPLSRVVPRTNCGDNAPNGVHYLKSTAVGKLCGFVRAACLSYANCRNGPLDPIDSLENISSTVRVKLRLLETENGFLT